MLVLVGDLSEYSPDLIIVRAAAERAIKLSDEEYSRQLLAHILDRRKTVAAHPAESPCDYRPDLLIGMLLAAAGHTSHEVRSYLVILLDGYPWLPSDPVMRRQAQRSLKNVDNVLDQRIHSSTLVRPAAQPYDELLVRPAYTTPSTPPDKLLRPHEDEK
jgi:hypothetical protein